MTRPRIDVRRPIVLGLAKWVGIAACVTTAIGAAAPPQVPAPQAAGAPSPVYRTGIDLTVLSVTVVDERARPVSGLTRGDFVVLEDGIPQQLDYFEVRDVPLDLMLLIDTSSSMQESLGAVRRAAAGFARVLKPGDRGAVIDFNQRVDVRQPFTDRLEALTTVIASSQPRGQTALYDAIYVALREFARRPVDAHAVRRQAMVVLSDGADNSSMMAFDGIMDEARRSGVAIYTIDLQRGTETVFFAGRWEVQRGPRTNFSLKTLARETGALSFAPTDERTLNEAYEHIADDLSHQYILGYVSKNEALSDAFRRVTVQTPHTPRATSRTRLGYVKGAAAYARADAAGATPR